MKLPINFETERLIIRKVEVRDWSALLDTFNSNEFPARLPLSRLNTESKVRSWIDDRSKDWDMDAGFVWSMEFKPTGIVIGQISLFPRESAYALAYWVNPESWSNGFATEACVTLIDQVKQSGYNNRLWAGTAEWNEASSLVLKKLNFRSIGTRTHLLANGIEEKINEYALDL
ncbi:GCN5-related N-acetyltransferase [Moritella viscosa]|uniref:GNAT family N-acetyltransferase n=1 Tax=Moritella viscosa TaxID=80854 RepID=UPI00092123BA|nr:GNAT family N-acetyltransferase [Moritella viscosa]SGZ03950.1 GCN5-related N-acetyltransferase [Moritella viscosa]